MAAHKCDYVAVAHRSTSANGGGKGGWAEVVAEVVDQVGAARTASVRPALAGSTPFADDAVGIEDQAAALILEAVHAGVLDCNDAALLTATAVLGWTVAEAARSAGLTGTSAYRF